MFNMASKPARRSILFAIGASVIKPNSDVEGRGRLDRGEYPSAENKKTASTTRESKTQVGTQERHGRLGDNGFSCSFCGDRHHRSGDCKTRLER